jgi:hypothetical protein
VRSPGAWARNAVAAADALRTPTEHLWITAPLLIGVACGAQRVVEPPLTFSAMRRATTEVNMAASTESARDVAVLAPLEDQTV